MHLVRIIKVHGEITTRAGKCHRLHIVVQGQVADLLSLFLLFNMYTSLFIHNRRNRRDVSSFMQNPERRSISRHERGAWNFLSLSLSRGSVTRDRIHGICTGYSLRFCDRNPMEITALLFPSIQVLPFSRLSFLLPLPCSYSCSSLSLSLSLSFFLFYFLHRENGLTVARVVGFSRSFREFHEIMSLLAISAAKYFSRF